MDYISPVPGAPPLRVESWARRGLADAVHCSRHFSDFDRSTFRTTWHCSFSVSKLFTCSRVFACLKWCPGCLKFCSHFPGVYLRLHGEPCQRLGVAASPARHVNPADYANAGQETAHACSTPCRWGSTRIGRSRSQMRARKYRKT